MPVSKRPNLERRWPFQKAVKRQDALIETTISIIRIQIAFIDKLEKRVKANKNVHLRPNLLTRDPRTKSRTDTLRSIMPAAAAPAPPEAFGTHPMFVTILTSNVTIATS